MLPQLPIKVLENIFQKHTHLHIGLAQMKRKVFNESQVLCIAKGKGDGFARFQRTAYQQVVAGIDSPVLGLIFLQ